MQPWITILAFQFLALEASVLSINGKPGCFSCLSFNWSVYRENKIIVNYLYFLTILLAILLIFPKYIDPFKPIK